MLLEDLLWLVLSAVIVRAVWHLVDGVMEGLRGPAGHAASSPRSRQTPRDDIPARGVQMVRDPVCGTYIVPDRAVVMADGSRQLFFCSATCRDKYRARTA